MRDGDEPAQEPARPDVLDLVDRRGTVRPPSGTRRDAALDRIVARVGSIAEFSEAQVREIANIVLEAMTVDDADRQRRDAAAHENRRRLRRLGRD